MMVQFYECPFWHMRCQSKHNAYYFFYSMLLHSLFYYKYQGRNFKIHFLSLFLFTVIAQRKHLSSQSSPPASHQMEPAPLTFPRPSSSRLRSELQKLKSPLGLRVSKIHFQEDNLIENLLFNQNYLLKSLKLFFKMNF